MFGEQPARAAMACNAVGDVQTRLDGEPGLAEVMPAWQDLRAAARALQAVCGQSTLLGQPTNDSLALAQARQRWAQGIQRELGVACDYLRATAVAGSIAHPRADDTATRRPTERLMFEHTRATYPTVH